MCRVLEVSKSGYYDYRIKKPSQEGGKDLEQMVFMKAIHARVKGSYGSRRMAKELSMTGMPTGRYKARALMQRAGIAARRPKRFCVTTESRHGYPVAPNRLNRRFETQRPNEAWVCDITYVWTLEGWLYLAVVLDLFSRKVIGWSTSDRLQAGIAQNALHMALSRRHPKPGCLVHSDRGVQYACTAYQQLLAEHGLVCSMSRKGDCWDNAVCERFFRSLKTERTQMHRYADRQEAKRDIVDYIEMFYNPSRLHSFLNYQAPNVFEKLAFTLY